LGYLELTQVAIGVKAGSQFDVIFHKRGLFT
jgi:hypothetical protein